jgi:hypothetical protein
MNNVIETYRGGRGRSGGGRSGGFSYGGGRSSSGRGSTTSGSYRGRGGDYRGSARVSSVGSSIYSSSSRSSSSSKSSSNSSKISGSSLRPSFGLNSDNYYSGKNKPNKPQEKKILKPIENPYRQTSTSNTKGVHGGSQWFGWEPTVLYPIIDEPPEIIASMNNNNFSKNENMSISEYDEKIKKRFRH